MEINLSNFVKKDYPFTYYIFDNFLNEDIARKLESEFPDYNSNVWYEYNNPVENKKALNSWYHFPPATYQFMEYLNSSVVVSQFERLTNVAPLYPDFGLHGAGWHVQGNGGLLNVHLDYALHPKTFQKRKMNLIIYLSDWEKEWGGNLELWTHDTESNKPKELGAIVECKFNRAVLFDASMNSWHGFSNAIACPKGKLRKSIAMYYHTDSDESDTRKRALYAPRKEQEDQKEVLEFIQQRVMLR